MSHTTKNILIGLLILVILFLVYCNKTIVEKPAVVSRDTIISRVEVADKEMQKTVDSSYKVITQLKAENLSITKQLQSARFQITDLYQSNQNLISQVGNAELKNDLIDNSEAIRKNCEGRDSLNQLSIANLNKQLSANDKIISAKTTFAYKLKSNLDTCLSNQAALERYAKQLQPRNELSVGLTANVNPAFGIGFIAQFRNKKGVAIQGSAMLLNGQVYNQVSVLKPISLRK